MWLRVAVVGAPWLAWLAWIVLAGVSGKIIFFSFGFLLILTICIMYMWPKEYEGTQEMRYILKNRKGKAGFEKDNDPPIRVKKSKDGTFEIV